MAQKFENLKLGVTKFWLVSVDDRFACVTWCGSHLGLSVGGGGALFVQVVQQAPALGLLRLHLRSQVRQRPPVRPLLRLQLLLQLRLLRHRTPSLGAAA